MIKYYLLSNDNISSNILEINILWKSIYYINPYGDCRRNNGCISAKVEQLQGQ